MPEGDTIHRAAATLRSVLVDREVARFAAPRLRREGPVAGTTVDAVDAVGKHLLVRFGDGTVLHTHLRMSGSWHTYRPGERWRRPRRQLRALVEVPDALAVCFNAPVVELLTDHEVTRHPHLTRLGPDLCDPDMDLDAVVERFAGRVPADAPIADALLDQSVAAGIGNVYKSEVLFLRGLHPATPASQVAVDERRELYRLAGSLLRHNLATVSRTTVTGGAPGSQWVYDRAGRPCRRCGEPIACQKLGDHGRVTYWCPGCQAGR